MDIEELIVPALREDFAFHKEYAIGRGLLKNDKEKSLFVNHFFNKYVLKRAFGSYEVQDDFGNRYGNNFDIRTKIKTIETFGEDYGMVIFIHLESYDEPLCFL